MDVLVCVVVIVAAAYWFLAHRGVLRAIALVLLLATPLVLGWVVARAGLLLELVVALALLALGVRAGREALEPETVDGPMPEREAPPVRHPVIVMNPRSGGGKVERFGLQQKAQDLGAEVVLLDGGQHTDVEQLAREAIAGRGPARGGGRGRHRGPGRGGGRRARRALHGDQRGTRNHFALDLGLDRTDPSTCLAALRDDAVELCVDLGDVEGRTFVNNASFGAYATVVQRPEYRDGKVRTTLDLLRPAQRRRRHPADPARRRCRRRPAPGDPGERRPLRHGRRRGDGPPGPPRHRPLGVVAVTVDSARQAVALLRRTSDHGLTTLAAREVVISSDQPEIAAGIDGEALLLPTPVTCTIRPRALRVRVPRVRPGVPEPRPQWSWSGSAGWPRTGCPRRSGDRPWLREAGHELLLLDRAVYQAVHATPSPVIDHALTRITHAANHSRLWVGVAAGMSLLGRRPRRGAAVGLAAVGDLGPGQRGDEAGRTA